MIINKRIICNYALEDMDPVFSANVIGRYVKIDGPLDFTFYFGSKFAGGSASRHNIRVKLSVNPEKFIRSKSHVLELHGEYHCSDERKVPPKLRRQIVSFFKKYKVLFAGVWEEQISEDLVPEFFKAHIDLQTLIQNSPCYATHKDKLRSVKTVADFEKAVRKYQIFKMYD